MKSTVENIVEKINETIAGQLKCKTGKEFPGQLLGIAFPIQIQDDDTNNSIPGIIDTDGECHYVFSDDDYAFGVYHRLLSKSYSKIKGFDDDVVINDITMIVWGFSNQLGMNALNFERKIIIPSIPKLAQLVSSDFDSYRVANSEFRNATYLYKPEEFIFSVKYKVQFKFDRICVLETKCI